MRNEANDETMYLYIGAYTDENGANYDYDTFLALHKEGWVSNYDVGIVKKNDAGKLAVTRHTNSTGKGARRGLVLGVLLGVVFPPSILAAGLVGLGAGAAVGHQFNDISRDDLREIGALLEDNETALVIIAEIKEKVLIDKAVKLALKEYKKEFTANKKDLDKQLNTAMRSM